MQITCLFEQFLQRKSYSWSQKMISKCDLKHDSKTWFLLKIRFRWKITKPRIQLFSWKISRGSKCLCGGWGSNNFPSCHLLSNKDLCFKRLRGWKNLAATKTSPFLPMFLLSSSIIMKVLCSSKWIGNVQKYTQVLFAFSRFVNKYPLEWKARHFSLEVRNFVIIGFFYPWHLLFNNHSTFIKSFSPQNLLHSCAIITFAEKILMDELKIP